MAGKPGGARAKGGEVADLSATVDEGMVRFDALRAERLEQLAAMREGRRAALEREHRRLEAWSGEDDPRVAALDERLGRDLALAGAVRVEAERAKTPAPEVGEAQWVLYGRVLDERLEPAADLVVAAHYPAGAPVKALGRACTDDRGAFRLAGAVEKAEQPAVHLRVHDGDETLLHVDERRLVPRRGRAEHLEIVLGKPPRPCPPAPKA